MKCPGQDSRYWKPGAIFEAKCPQCGHAVEFFKDDTTRLCKHCGHRFLNPDMDFGCASYCRYAEQCLGSLSPELLAQRENLLKERVAVEVKKRLANDFQRIGHAMRTARYAEQLGKAEAADLPVILSAAYLYRIGSDANQAVAMAREILSTLGAADELVERVCAVVAGPASAGKASPEMKVVHDADLIAGLDEKKAAEGIDRNRLKTTTEDLLQTQSGRELAGRILAS
jgi:hypothetical protein